MSDVSIKEVAKLAGVSIATVSRCVNNPEKVSARTLAKVRSAILETGYAPNPLARNFRRGRTNLVMVVLPSIGDPFFTDVMRGIRKAAKARGYSVLIEETQRNTMTADEISAMLVSKQTDGIILLASTSPFGTEILSAKSHRRLPIVIGCETVSPELSDFPSVHIDNIAAAMEATRHLVDHGHRRIAMIRGEADSLLTRDRELGYRQAMQEAGLAIDAGWVVEGDMTLDGAIHATGELLANDQRPTAIFCANDEMAIGALHAIKAAGLDVPRDLSLIGFDDVRYAAVMDPPLTTIAQPAEEIGERVMQRLCREIDDEAEENAAPEIVPHQLVIRDSTGAPPT